MVSEIEALVRAYVAASTGMQFEVKRGFWDHEDPTPVLHPEERATPLVCWPDIDAYWSETRASLATLDSTVSNVIAWRLDDSLAACTYALRWRATMRDSFLTAPLAGDNRVVMLLRKRADGWRIFHYVESPLSLATVVERLGRRAARKGGP